MAAEALFAKSFTPNPPLFMPSKSSAWTPMIHPSLLTFDISREMDILRKIDSPSVVKCEGVFYEAGNVNFVLEFMDGGSLAELLKQRTRILPRKGPSTVMLVGKNELLKGVKEDKVPCFAIVVKPKEKMPK